MHHNGIQIRNFYYKLSYDEAYETFYILAFNLRKRYRTGIGILLTAVAVILLGFYASDRQKVHFMYLAVISAALLFYLLYFPLQKARRGARAVQRQDGYYRIAIVSDGTMRLFKKNVPLKGDRHARAVETEDVFIIRPDSCNTVCIPKRIMNDDEMDFVRSVLKEYVKYIYQ